MKGMRLYSEPFAKTGNIAAEGYRRLLGRPNLDLLQTLIREGMQNILDAATERTGPTALIRLRLLKPREHRVLSDRVFSELPSASPEIHRALSSSQLRVLELCDFGTEGLSGPTRADMPYDGSEPLNFVNFLRNVGAARDIHHGGGTYGYGKSSLYAASSCSTIIVDSQTRCAGQYERRLMACHLGKAYEGARRKRFTGRHWWGVLDGTDSVEPLRQRAATEISDAIGMPTRERTETGTSILVLDPLLESDDMASAADEIVESVLWTFWPRMTSSTPRRQRLRVRVEMEERRITVPAPEQFPPFDLFASALADCRNGASEVRHIDCLRPKKRLGHLAIRKGLCGQRRAFALREDSVVPKQACHIALMRPVGMVVKYVSGDAFPDARYEWGGVFVCSDEDEIEEAFASAEPPAHDDWIPDNLPKGREKTFVRVALRQIDEGAKTFVNPSIADTGSGSESPSLAATASKMGSFLDRVLSTGPGRPARKPGEGSGRRAISISAPRFEGLQLDNDGKPLARFSAELRNDGSVPFLRVLAEPHLVADGGYIDAEDLPELFTPIVKEMISGNGRMSEEGPWLYVGAMQGRIEVLITTVPNAAVGLKLRLASGDS